MSEWQKLAEVAGVRWCPGHPGPPENTVDHIHGAVTHDGVGKHIVHWSNRKVTRPGIVRFLRLIVRGRHGWDKIEEWWQIYQMDNEVWHLAYKAGHRLERKLFSLNRARLREALGQIIIQERRTWTYERQETYRKAIRWAVR